VAQPSTIRTGYRYQALALLTAWIVLFGATARAAPDDMTIAVLYPEVSGAYAQVFTNIIAGIREIPGIRVVPHVLTDASDDDALVRRLHDEASDAVIALGQRGYRFAKKADLQLPVVIGATLISPDGFNGISLSADPEQFFKRLGSLTPPVKRVFMVYSDRNNGWLIPLAKRVAARHDVELHAMKADDARSAVRHYHTILQQVRDLQDAIWLPLDNVAPDKVVLPMVLQAAWNKRLVVFSNNPSHVRQGALFSLFPRGPL